MFGEWYWAFLSVLNRPTIVMIHPYTPPNPFMYAQALYREVTINVGGVTVLYGVMGWGAISSMASSVLVYIKCSVDCRGLEPLTPYCPWHHHWPRIGNES